MTGAGRGTPSAPARIGRSAVRARPPAARAALYAVLGAWAVLTTLNQHPRRGFDRLRVLDPAGLWIPDWRFFAPDPGTLDYHVLYRDRLPDGSMTLWTEIDVFERRRLGQVLVHPNRRREKALYDAVNDLTRYRPPEGGGPEDIQLSVGYLTLLTFVTHAARHHEDADRTQFLIAMSTGFDEREEPYPVFTSNLHPLG